MNLSGKPSYSLLSVLILIILIAVVSCGKVGEPPLLPETSIKTVIDTLHGMEIADNYRWLENGEDSQVVAWADQQDEYCRYFLHNYSGRKQLQTAIEEVLKIGVVHSPAVYGGRYFYFKRFGEEDHDILYMRRTPDGAPEIVLNPNEFSEDMTVALDWWYPSPDGKLIAFGKSSQGTENSTLYLMDIDSKEMLADTIPYTHAVSLAWTNDNSGFYYTRFPKPGSVPEGEEVYFRWLYYHKIGTGYKSDPHIYGDESHKTDWVHVQLSPDNKYLFVPVYQGWNNCDIFLKNLEKNSGFTEISGDKEAIHTIYPMNDGFYLFTNYDAPRYRIMKASYKKPKIKNWKEIIPEQEAIKEAFTVIDGKIVLAGLENASSRVSIYDLDGNVINDIKLPSLGSVTFDDNHGFGGELEGNELLFGYNSFFIPPTIYRYQMDTGELTIFDEIKTDLELSQFEVEQVWYPSKDGTKISMFLTHRKDIKLDGGNPTLVYGYGGFNVNQKPYFSRTMTLFLNKGGVYASTQLRGGGEYGEEWHRAGMLENKQNSFDDMIAACEWLIENEYTSSDKLIIEGGSNGGLLVGAVAVQRPDLMKAVVCGRPLLDMLRYHKFLIGSLWIPEYGSADDPEQFKFIYDYSPYHHVIEGAAYPAILFESADHDTRVDPMHTRKMAAAMQAATSSDAPILLRIQKKTGHGQGAPKRIWMKELIDEWCFIYWQLGL